MKLIISSSMDLTTIENLRRRPSRTVNMALLKKTIDQWHGWVRCQVEFRHKPGQSLLELHANWHGPLKLTESVSGQDAVRQCEFYLDDTRGGDADPTCDEEWLDEHWVLCDELVAAVAAVIRQSPVDDWHPPETATLSQWLRECGHDAVVDENQGLRFTIAREGLAGQVRVSRGDDHLRFVLPLGRWDDLHVDARHSIERLAHETNRRTRLARVVVTTNDLGTLNCEAQVDLTGLPWNSDRGRCQARFWQTMVRQAATSLTAAHNQLGLELAVLAEPANSGVPELLSQFLDSSS